MWGTHLYRQFFLLFQVSQDILQVMASLFLLLQKEDIQRKKERNKERKKQMERNKERQVRRKNLDQKASASEEPWQKGLGWFASTSEIQSTQLMTKTIMDTIVCGENSVDKGRIQRGKERKHMEIIANELVKKLEERLNLDELDKQMKGLEIKEHEIHSLKTTAKDLKPIDIMRNKKYISSLEEENKSLKEKLGRHLLRQKPEFEIMEKEKIIFSLEKIISSLEKENKYLKEKLDYEPISHRIEIMRNKKYISSLEEENKSLMIKKSKRKNLELKSKIKKMKKILIDQDEETSSDEEISSDEEQSEKSKIHSKEKEDAKAEEVTIAPIVESLTCPDEEVTIAQQIQLSMMQAQQIQVSMMVVVQDSVDSIFIEGKNSVDTPTKLRRPRKDGSPYKPKLTKQDRNKIGSEFVSKFEKNLVKAIEEFDFMKLADKRTSTLRYENAELKKKNVEFEMEIKGLKKEIKGLKTNLWQIRDFL